MAKVRKPARTRRCSSISGLRHRRSLLAASVFAFALFGCKTVQSLEHIQPISFTNGVIRGRVMSRETQQPVARAIVILLGQDSLPVKDQTSVAYTNTDGQFQFPNARPGTYRLRAEAEGFAASVVPMFVIDVGITYTTDLLVAPRHPEGPSEPDAGELHPAGDRG